MSSSLSIFLIKLDGSLKLLELLKIVDLYIHSWNLIRKIYSFILDIIIIGSIF